MRRSFKFLLRPTCRQAQLLNECLRDHRLLYNAALEERREAWKRQRVTVHFYAQSAQMPFIRANDPDMARWSSKSQGQTLRNLHRAFESFFRRVRNGEAPGYPRFKGADRFNSVIHQDGDGAEWIASTKRIRLQGVGHIRVHAHRPVRGTVKTITVSREGRRWYVVLSCVDVPTEQLATTGAVTGVDLGVASLLTTSEGVHVPNPKHGRANHERLASAQRALSRCKRGSRRRLKAKAKVAQHLEKVKNQRRDAAHKVALDLVRAHDVIVHEALRVGNMTRSGSGDVNEPGTQVAQKAGLNRSILDAGWGEFLEILRGKAEWAGREVIAVNPRNTSRCCAQCGHVAAENRVSQAEFRCQACGHGAHADVNAAVNILRAGLALRETENAA